MLALIGAINGIATVAAPIAGGILAGFGGWKGIFWFLCLLGVALLVGTLYFKETLPQARRQCGQWISVLQNFGTVFRNRTYMSYVFQYGFTMSVLFVNIASAPFIMQQHYGLSPLSFSLCFGINAIAMVISSGVAVKLPTMERALQTGSYGMILFAAMICTAPVLRMQFLDIRSINFLPAVDGRNELYRFKCAGDGLRTPTCRHCLGTVGGQWDMPPEVSYRLW